MLRRRAFTRFTFFSINTNLPSLLSYPLPLLSSRAYRSNPEFDEIKRKAEERCKYLVREKDGFNDTLRSIGLVVKENHPFSCEEYIKIFSLVSQLTGCDFSKRGAAVKLLAFFGNYEDAALALRKMEVNQLANFFTKLRSLPLSACHTWNIELWQALAKKHMLSDAFMQVFSHAAVIEENIKHYKSELINDHKQTIINQHQNRLASQWGELNKEVGNSNQSDYIQLCLDKQQKQIKKEIREQFNKAAYNQFGFKEKLSDSEKDNLLAFKTSPQASILLNEIAEKVNKKFLKQCKENYVNGQKILASGRDNYIQSGLQYAKDKIHSEAENLKQHLLSPHTDLETLIKHGARARYKDYNYNPRAAELFFQYNKTERDLATYLSWEVNDSDEHIPPVFIEGKVIGYTDFYLRKEKPDNPEVAVFGHLTNCCQSVGNRAGEYSVEHGITSPYGGFYALRKKSNDEVIAQCWAWRGRNGGIVLDSVESQYAYAKDQTRHFMLSEFFGYLAYQLVTQYQVSQVLVGRSAHTPAHLGKKCGDREVFRESYFLPDSETQFLLSKNGHEKMYLYVLVQDAIRKGLKDKLSHFLEFYPEVKGDHYGAGMLSHAVAQTDNVELMQLVLEQGGDVNQCDKENMTLLHVATKYRRENMVKYLLSAGADVCARSAKGETAIEMAGKDTSLIEIVEVYQNRASQLRF